jgi:GT2 family glycosyltransferase/SAM-dependent methyltransferase
MRKRNESSAKKNDDLYDANYYASHCGPFPYDRSIGHWLDFFGKIADELIRIFQPVRVFDAGCAHGFLVEAFWDRGVEASGRDISQFAISQVRADIRQFCSVGNLTEKISGKYDLVVCIEVLEHMSEQDGAKAIANMAAVTDNIVFSSSPTDLTEPTHVNVKPAIYWMRLFAAQGFRPNAGIFLPTITPYALVFSRADVAPQDQDLIVCAELVGARIQLAERAHTIHHLSEAVAERDRSVAERDRLIVAQDSRIAQIATEMEKITELQQTCAQLHSQIEERDQLVASQHAQIAEFGQARASMQSQVAERDQLVDQLTGALSDQTLELEQMNVTLQSRIAERDLITSQINEIAELRDLVEESRKALAPRDNEIANLVQAIFDARNRIAALDHTILVQQDEIAKCNLAITGLESKAAEQNEEIGVLRDTNLSKETAIEEARNEARFHQAAYHAILTSTSWRLTETARSILERSPPVVRQTLRQALKILSPAAFRNLSQQAAAVEQSNNGFLDKSSDGDTSVSQARPVASIDFDGPWYLSQNKDVAASGTDPLYHYLTYGRAEGRFPSPRALAESSSINLIELCDPNNEEFVFTPPDDAFFVSVLTPAYNTEPRYLRELFQTLMNQQYPAWEWIVVDDGSTNPATILTLRQLAELDPRVRLILNPTNLGIAGASNVALAAARGTHAALVDHDDLLARDAFRRIHEDWKLQPATQLFYTDECKLLADGTLDQFWAKPDWSPAYLENTMCIGHLSVYEMNFLRELGGFRPAFDGTQDYDLALRASLKQPRVRHLPIFAYLWRIIPGSSASDLSEKHYAIERQRLAVLDYARHKCPDAMVVPGWGAGYWRIRYQLASPAPLLSYVIPAGGGSRTVRGERIDLIVNCIRSFEEKKFYPNREYIVVHNHELPEDQLCALKAIRGVVLVHHAAPLFNFSETVNIGVGRASGEYICLLNDDVEAITPKGGEELISYLAQSPKVGAIGPLCLHEDEKIQQNGVVMLAVGPAHAGDRRPQNFGGHQFMMRCRREAFVIGAAMMIVKKAVFEKVGGFSEDFPLNYNDVDFGLKLRDHGYSSVVDPSVMVYHYESTSKIGTSTVEQERLFIKHSNLSDPYFSKWFDQNDPNFQLSLKPARLSPHFGRWLERHIARRSKEFIPRGLNKLSVCVSVYNQPKRLLEEMYKSVSMQTYANKELVIVDNGSSDKETLAWLEHVAAAGWAKVVRVEENIGISGANLKLLDNMTGDFFVPMDADDFMSVDALQMMAFAIEQNPGKMLFYSDEYKSDVNSSRFSPFFKPDFDPVLLMNCCYPAHLMAINGEFLRQIGSYRDDRATWCHDYDTLTRALAIGQEPVHVRELVYAWRINPGSTASAETGTKPGTVESQRFVLSRLLRDRGLEDILSVQPNTLESSSGMWRLRAERPVPKVKVINASKVWGDSAINAAELASLASEPDIDWLAILLSPRDRHGLLELSAVALFDPRVNAVCGLLMDKDEKTIRWSGGLFVPGGRILDPCAGRQFAEGGYHGQIWCQRCVDVPAPINLLVRSKALRRAATRLKDDAGVDDLMVLLGLDAHARGDFIAITPHLRAVLPKASRLLPLDRSGLLRGKSSLSDGGRWYDGRLSTDQAYAITDWPQRG